jgi:hypothetical protein
MIAIRRFLLTRTPAARAHFDGRRDAREYQTTIMSNSSDEHWRQLDEGVASAADGSGRIAAFSAF